MSSVGDAAEKIGRDEGLAGAGGQRKQGAGWAVGCPVLGSFLEDSTDGRVLVVASSAFPSLVRLQEGSGDRIAQGKALRGFIASAQLIRRRKFAHGAGE